MLSSCNIEGDEMTSKLAGSVKPCLRLVYFKVRYTGHYRRPPSRPTPCYTDNAGRNITNISNCKPIADITPKRTATEEFRVLGEEYTKAKASHTSWKTDVNLARPFGRKYQPPIEDKYIWDYYTSLQYTLFETGYPETVDRTDSPRYDRNPEQVTVALLASPFECIGMLLEGGRQLPDGFHLILSPSWLSREQSSHTPGTNSLLVHKAITFGMYGTSYIDEFKTPRRVTYFVNFFTENVTGGQRADGEALEDNIDCPISSSMSLVELIDNKLWTRHIMAEVGMPFPETLGLIYKPKWKNKQKSNDKINIIKVSDNDVENTAYISELVTGFLKQLEAKGVAKVVVKPSGPKFYGSIGVSFHNVGDSRHIVGSVAALLAEVEPGGAVLVETFEEFQPLQSDLQTTVPWSADRTLGFRIKVTVCRNYDNSPITSMITCVTGSKASPINGDNGVSQTLDSMLLGFGVTDGKERKRLQDEIYSKSEAVFQRIVETERSEIPDGQLPPGAQTDVLGIDFVISRRNGELTAIGIEVNSHDCTINCQIAQFMSALYTRIVPLHRDKLGTGTSLGISVHECSGSDGNSFRPWVQTMICRSQDHVMRGKRVVVVGAGGYSKRKIWVDAQAYGIEVILVDCNKNHFAESIVSHFIHYDFVDHSRDVAHARNIVDILEEQGMTVDGCLTFWEDCVPIASLVPVSTQLQMPRRRAEHKSVLRTRRDDIPHWPRTYLYSSNMYRLNNSKYNEAGMQGIKYPAILKLDHGSSAVGVSLATNERDLQRQFSEVSESLKTETDFSGIGLGHDNSMVVMDYHEGSEHDVDIVIFGRKPIAAFISDNGPTRVPRFTETAAMMPSTLPRDKQAQLVTAAYQCCTDIGLSDGTFNVELKMTSTGPKLIEINARMGGFYLREWIQKLYGVDIMLYSFMVACGVRPFFPKQPSNRCLIGVMLLPSLHSHVLSDSIMLEKVQTLQTTEDMIWTQFAENVEVFSEVHEEPFANIAVIGDSVEQTKVKLLRLCKMLEIDKEDYNVSHFIRHF